ncbi:pirin family protein [Flexibacterium corallicola]|uniref:pirin family protein n=1 Tax=Flexibacterium corallicola TaxID=3037259 RepID=UPI00286ECE09|nr:pirin family protein [Pseudovibrio sp. M1P-2-3]
MKYHRPSNERGRGFHGWLDSRHTFSFANYYDAGHMGFGPLRVINEDKVLAGHGFDTHPHRNMEIISYVVEGALEHRDSMGEVAIIKRGDVQRMSAGTGVYHSEYNASKENPVHFLQIWIMPDTKNISPTYAQKRFEDLDGKLRLVASHDGRDGSISIHASVDLYASKLKEKEIAHLQIGKDRGVWVQLVHGQIFVNGQLLEAGDGLALAKTPDVSIVAEDSSEFLLFDMAL